MAAAPIVRTLHEASDLLAPSISASRHSLRPETTDDQAFLIELYRSVRWHEVAYAPWPEEQKYGFLDWQCDLQRRHYKAHYPEADYAIVILGGEPIGRFYRYHGRDEVRIVDISLLPAYRGQGLGTAVLKDAIATATAQGKTVSLHVEQSNPARRLYERLGFREASRDEVYALMTCRADVTAAR